jgi:F0F1-type ATP synthase assembly protein I
MSRDRPGLGDLFGLGVALAANLAVGFGLGWLLDSATGTYPVFAFVGFGLGLLSAGATVYRLSKRFM